MGAASATRAHPPTLKACISTSPFMLVVQALLAFGSPRRAEDRRGLCQRMACRIRQPCFPFPPRMHHAACVATHLHGNIRQVPQFRNFKFHAGKHRTRRMRALDHQQRHKTYSARCSHLCSTGERCAKGRVPSVEVVTRASVPIAKVSVRGLWNRLGNTRAVLDHEAEKLKSG